MSDFNVDFSKLGAVENGDIIPLGSDAEFHATFHLAKVPNFDGTDFTEVPHLRLQAPGNTKSVYDQPVRLESHPGRPSDPERFPRQWADFQRGQTGATGTSILDLASVTDNDARRFELMGITTIEQLAAVADSNLANIGVGAMALRDQARRHLAGEGSGEAMKAKIDKMEAVIEMLMAEREPQPAKPTAKAKDKIDA